MNRLLLTAACCFAFSLAACAGSTDAASADDADESASVTSNESALTTELSDEVSQPVSMPATDVAQAAATRVGSHLSPAGCLTTMVSGATVTYTFNDCTGPYGMVHLTGVVTAVYTHAASGEVDVALSGTGLKVNKSTLDLAATVKATKSDGVRTATVVANSQGTGPRGNTLTRDGSYTVTYDSGSQCITINGTWTTKVGAATASTVVSDYVRCKGVCPKAGGSIAHTTLRTHTVTVTYDGSAVANWTTSGGKSGTLNLICAAN